MFKHILFQQDFPAREIYTTTVKSCLLLSTPVGYKRFTSVWRGTFRKDDPHENKRSSV